VHSFKPDKLGPHVTLSEAKGLPSARSEDSSSAYGIPQNDRIRATGRNQVRDTHYFSVFSQCDVAGGQSQSRAVILAQE